jgi:hypothetical protein
LKKYGVQVTGKEGELVGEMYDEVMRTAKKA